MAPKNPVKVADYTVLPLTIPPSDSYPTATKHYLYVRAHAPKIPDADTNRSLFASNLPIDASENSLRTLFSEQLGGARLDRVEIEGARPKKDQRGAALSGADSGTTKAGKKRKRGANTDVDFTAIELPQTWDKEILKSGSGAVLVFVDKASAELALKEVARAAKKKSEVRWKGEDGLGIESRSCSPDLSLSVLTRAGYRIHHHLTFPPRDLLQTTVNTFLTKWANMEGARARAMAKQRSVPDDDGFVTVTRGGRAGPARLEEAQAAGEKLKEKQKPPENFYRFQTREKKKETAEKLKREFQEDRKRVERMRAFKGKIKVRLISETCETRLTLVSTAGNLSRYWLGRGCIQWVNLGKQASYRRAGEARGKELAKNQWLCTVASKRRGPGHKGWSAATLIYESQAAGKSRKIARAKPIGRCADYFVLSFKSYVPD